MKKPDLSMEEQNRPVLCPSCTVENPANAPKCHTCETPLLLHDRYLLRTVIGQREAVMTYLAFDSQGRKPVVVKELSYKQLAEWKTEELFEREIAALEQLDHPAIPRYIDDFKEATGRNFKIYLVQAFISGTNLLEQMKSHRFTESDVLEILKKALAILSYLHQLNPPMIHRDIKPSNILVDPKQQLYLIDFGAVKSGLIQKQGSTVAGTFGYMPPEQLSGRATPSSDIYALGVTAVHLLTQTDPQELFDVTTPDRWKQVLAAQNISKRAIKVLSAFLDPDPQKRPANGKDALVLMEAAEKRLKPAREAEAVRKPAVYQTSPAAIFQKSEKESRPKPPLKKPFRKAIAISVFVIVGIITISTLIVLSLLSVTKTQRPVLRSVHKPLTEKKKEVPDSKPNVRVSPPKSAGLTDRQLLTQALTVAKKGNEALNQGDWDQAIVFYTQAIKVCPRCLHSLRWRAQAYNMKGEYQKAIADCTTLLAISKPIPHMVERKQGPFVTYSFDTNPDYQYKAKVVCAYAWNALGDFEKALSSVNGAIAQDRKFSEGYHCRGTVYYDQKDYDAAIPDFSKAINNPKSTGIYEIYNDRGMSWAQKKEYARAVDDFSQSIRLKSDYRAVYHNRAAMYAYQGIFQNAVRDLAELIRLQIKQKQDSLNRRLDGFIWDKTDWISTTAQFLANKIKLNLNPGFNYFGRGVLLFYQKSYKKAIADLTIALRFLGKSDPRLLAYSYLIRGAAWNYEGNKVEAAKDAQMACDYEYCELMALLKQ